MGTEMNAQEGKSVEYVQAIKWYLIKKILI